MMAQPALRRPIRNSTSEAGKLSQAQVEKAASMSEEQTPVEQVPPASRLGEIMGWSLLALAVACFISFIVTIVQEHAAWEAMRHAQDAWFNANLDHSEAAYAAYMAAKAAYNETTLRVLLSLDASIVFLLLIPGLLYAMKPSLLGGPLGRLLRTSSTLVQRQPQRHPVTFYQGIGFALGGIGAISASLIPMVPILIPTMLWLMFPAFLMHITFLFLGTSLRQATWWFASGRGAKRGQERPQA
jgi:hypothetical protein